MRRSRPSEGESICILAERKSASRLLTRRLQQVGLATSCHLGSPDLFSEDELITLPACPAHVLPLCNVDASAIDHVE